MNQNNPEYNEQFKKKIVRDQVKWQDWAIKGKHYACFFLLLMNG